MGVELPAYSRSEFCRRLQRASPERLDEAAVAALWSHYRELRRWSPRLALLGAGTAASVVERHYGESLAGLPLLPESSVGARLVDIGSGAGFPGLVLAAARPRLEVRLFESRQRKWAFLAAACRRAELSCECRDARVEVPLPDEMPPAVDVVTSRAVRLERPVLEALAERLSPGGRMLLWSGEEGLQLPAGLAVRDEVGIAESRYRRILDIRRHP